MRLTMYLLRDGADITDNVFRESAHPTLAAARKLDSKTSATYVIEGKQRHPDWVKDISQVADLDANVVDFMSQSLGAVLLVMRADRVFAITFGTGFHAIKPALIERGFGLRVTANVVNDDKVRSAQTRGVARDTRDRKTILPVDGQFADLDVEVNEDWLRQLSGTAADKNFGTSISGSDSLRITVPNFSIQDIESKIDEILLAYKSMRYVDAFPFLDQITPIDKSDPVVEDLDAAVAKQLRAHEPRITFAAPDPFELERLDHFEMTANYNRFDLEELGNEAIYAIIDELKPDKNPLNAVRVFAVDGDGGYVDRVRDLRSYVQTEVEHDGISYLLSAGLWFTVREDFAGTIDAQIKAIPDLSAKLGLPIWDAVGLKADTSDSTAEGSYNILVANKKGFALMDKKMLHLGPQEKIEICDLLTPDGEFLCVKSATSSATLSHLVAQAVVSAAAWGHNKYQSHLSTFWTELKPGAKPLARKDATFVLTIATPKPGPLADSLFFFTKVQIANSIEQITRGGFSVALAKIDMTGVVANKRPRAKKAASVTFV